MIGGEYGGRKGENVLLLSTHNVTIFILELDAGELGQVRVCCTNRFPSRTVCRVSFHQHGDLAGKPFALARSWSHYRIRRDCGLSRTGIAGAPILVIWLLEMAVTESGPVDNRRAELVSRNC